MNSEFIYLDHAATTPVRREVLEAMFPYFQEAFGNPSSVHSYGAHAAAGLREARQDVALVLGALPEEIVFTSGGTESDNLAVIGAAEAASNRGDHVVVSTVEHEAVLQSAQELQRRGYSVDYLPVDSTGLVDPDQLLAHITERTILVSCIYANNEIGTVEPIAKISRMIHQRYPQVVIHTDAVQAAGHLSLNVDELGVDLLSLSAHKIYGPRGMGVLYVRQGTRLWPQLHGGGQEGSLRSGTENVAACVGLARALSLADAERDTESLRLSRLRDRLMAGMMGTSDSLRPTGHDSLRLPGHASFYLVDRSAESVLVDLDVRGIMCSSGSACHAGMTEPSHVLLAIGLPLDLARNGLRMTLGRDTTDDDVDRVVSATHEILARRPLAAGI